MLRDKKTKTSKYIVYIGWELSRFADNMNDINNLVHLWGQEKIYFETLKK